MQEKLFNMLFNEDDITWQSMIYQLVREEGMDPWDIDLKVLAKRFLETINKLKRLDFRISGKIILAAAILLRLKSKKLIDEDIGHLNTLIAMTETDEELYDELGYEDFNESYSGAVAIDKDKFRLIPKTPQPRKRKVSVYDLVEALQKALEVKKRRKKRALGESHDIEVPEKQKDITEIILEIYSQIKSFILKKKAKKLLFSELVPSNERKDKIYAFTPLLHLDYQQKIELKQEKHLGEIEIYMRDMKLEQ